MVRAGRGRIVSVVCGYQQQIILIHAGSNRSKSPVELLQRQPKARGIVAMTIQHVEILAVGEEEIPVFARQRCFNGRQVVAVRLQTLEPRETIAPEERPEITPIALVRLPAFSSTDSTLGSGGATG